MKKTAHKSAPSLAQLKEDYTEDLATLVITIGFVAVVLLLVPMYS